METCYPKAKMVRSLSQNSVFKGKLNLFNVPGLFIKSTLGPHMITDRPHTEVTSTLMCYPFPIKQQTRGWLESFPLTILSWLHLELEGQ